MSERDIESAIGFIQEAPDADFEGPKPESVVDAAEKALGFRFPPTYRAFLKQLGCGDIGGIEIYGVISTDFQDSGVPDGIWLTLKEREESRLPHDLCIVAQADDGAYMAIDMSQLREDGEAPVIVWLAGAENDRRKQIVAEDFGAFLHGQLESIG